MKIFSYYQSIALSEQSEEFACSNYWKQSWENNGWQSSMLNKSHAQSSSLFNKMSQKLLQIAPLLPSEIIASFDWIIARYVRWCALHAAGGGWMCDYDVINKKFTPSDAEKLISSETFLVNNDSAAYLFYATKEHAENAIKIFITEPLHESNRLISEFEILKYDKNCSKLLKKIQHVKCVKNQKRSEVMKSLL